MGRVIWTNGCFDILHKGHIELFKHAKSLGSKLFVGIDSDEKVKKDKGSNRPFNNVQDRKEVLESIKYIDGVFIFNDTQGLDDLIRVVGPNIMVIGSDWRGKTVVGEQHVEEVVFFDRLKDYSTTNILKWTKSQK
jgi:rfaE bifunctional protein nucleotidyltransferase chain/domain|tara:strand:+ start:190 stop:594 length:405 start_codon:yes stop_codon:yes gene_type:complete